MPTGDDGATTGDGTSSDTDADDEDLDRVVLFQELDPDRVEEYVEAHDDVPDAVPAAMARGGVEEFRLFVGQDVSVGYVEVADVEEYNEVYMDDEECLEWERFTEQFKRSGVDADEGEMPLLEEVWSFEREE